jgi:aminomethyltransferase
MAQLGYFKLVQTTIANCLVTISRTGYTGDLGYEIWISAEDALTVWDAIWAAGRDYNLTPIGTTALMYARIEAGLLLIGVDFHPARYAWVDAQRERPHELGLGGMVRGDREYIGRSAAQTAPPRWHTVGIVVDWRDYERIHRAAGIMPPMEGVLNQETMSIYRPNSDYDYLGYVSSFCYSSLLKKHIGIAKLHPDYAAIGTEVELEISVIRKPEYVLARVVPLPFYNTSRKRL